MYPLSGAAAYDRAITVFSPDGKLYQVEYAANAADRGTTGVGIVYKDGVLLAADKKIVTPLIVSSSFEKLFLIEDHIAIVYSGLVGDARALAEFARDFAEQHRLLYGEPVDVETLAKEIAKIKQIFTQYGGIRPFGVMFLIAGYDERPRLFETQPSGTLLEYYADAIGRKKYDVMSLLEKKWKKDMSLEDAEKLATEALKLSLDEGEKLTPERVVMVYIDEERKVKFVPEEEIAKLLK